MRPRHLRATLEAKTLRHAVSVCFTRLSVLLVTPSEPPVLRALDSPMQMPGGFPSPSPGSSATIPQTPLNMFSEHNDSDVEILAHKLQTIRLAGSGIDA